MAFQAQPNPAEGFSFWRDALAWRGSITPRLAPRIVLFGLYASAVAFAHRFLKWPGVDDAYLGYTAGALAVLLVLRTNTGYERWWEARKLWGGIVNQSRNLAIKALAYGPDDDNWKGNVVRWAAAFCHAARQGLRAERNIVDFERVFQNVEDAKFVIEGHHLASTVASRLAVLLDQARREFNMDGFSFMEIDRERALLIDHIGGCERILKTPLPRVHSIKLRRFILFYLLSIPFAIGSPSFWVAPVATMLIAYPLLAIDQIGYELENPFSATRASHLPLNVICQTIEGDLMALLSKPGALGQARSSARGPLL